MITDDKVTQSGAEKQSDTLVSEGTRAYIDRLNSYAGNGQPPIIRKPVAQRSFWNAPVVVLFVAAIFMVAMVFYGIGASRTGASSSNAGSATTSSSSSSSSDTMSNSSSTTSSTTANVPLATQKYGNQLAKYTIDSDGAKHFTLTASQVMWTPVTGGQPVLAWAINGTVPGPMIRVTAGDRVRITFINHFPAATSIHWHGLQVPSSEDGVPGVGQKPIEPGQTFVYNFSVGDQDVGTHWYHSHYNDLIQLPGGFYGAFIVDPRPGTPEYRAYQADVEYTMFVSEFGSYFVINGKSFPDTQPIMVKHGQKVIVRIIGAGEMIHPMHLHGHTFDLFAQAGHLLAQPIPMDTIEVVPGGTYDITFNAWAAPGSVYPFHCHILSHLMNPGQSASEMGGLIVLVEYAKQ